MNEGGQKMRNISDFPVVNGVMRKKSVLKRNDIQKNHKHSQWSMQRHGPL